MPAKREPAFGQPWAPQASEAPKARAPRPQPLGQPVAQKGIRIERPRTEQAPAAVQNRIEVQGRPLAVEMAGAASESFAEDDLEIPAFLRRRAN